ncbi:hypothetical protein TNIN_274031 [Trichonephila inaurata madagascariensis]|uniref:Uncharacterized protein n=1 Tax=Trichonephila inaurata madagascariensis TaxID=2747483 RepID=A0A8X7C1Y6_9ARAC|nr:hypothetical protein TNIN_274031 [Trichonephila inaurata madagascariensis]
MPSGPQETSKDSNLRRLVLTLEVRRDFLIRDPSPSSLLDAVFVMDEIRQFFSLIQEGYRDIRIVRENIKASEELWNASYSIATQSIINTTICLEIFSKNCRMYLHSCSLQDFQLPGIYSIRMSLAISKLD